MEKKKAQHEVNQAMLSEFSEVNETILLVRKRLPSSQKEIMASEKADLYFEIKSLL
jgi:hypothetical protein